MSKIGYLCTKVTIEKRGGRKKNNRKEREGEMLITSAGDDQNRLSLHQSEDRKMKKEKERIVKRGKGNIHYKRR